MLFRSVSPERDFVSLSIHFPKSSAQIIIPLVAKFFTEALFSEDKIDILKNNLKRNLAVNLEKTSYLAYSGFIASVFSSAHPYGVSLQMEDIDQLQRNDIVDFYKQYYHGGNMRLFAAGNIDADFLQILDDTFGNIPFEKPAIEKIIPMQKAEKGCNLEKENAVQSSICIGKRLFDYTDRKSVV